MRGVRLGAVLAAAMLVAGCNNDSERIEELEGKIEQLESQRASLAGSPTASPTPAASAAPSASPTASASPRAAPASASGNVCADGQDRHLTIANRGEETMMYFYASPPSAGDWEEDVLSSDVVVQGDSYRINFNTDARCTCVYDTRAVFADDSEVIRKANVCTDHSQTYP